MLLRLSTLLVGLIPPPTLAHARESFTFTYEMLYAEETTKLNCVVPDAERSLISLPLVPVMSAVAIVAVASAAKAMEVLGCIAVNWLETVKPAPKVVVAKLFVIARL